MPVIATLSGEDSFLEKLPAPYYAQARAELRARAADLAGLVALCRYYADFMAGYLAVPREKIDVIRPGLNLDGYGGGEGRATGDRRRSSEHRPKWPEKARPKTIGFLSRICADKGLHLLVERAACDAAKRATCRRIASAWPDISTGPTAPISTEIQKRVAAWGMADRFEYVGELDRAGKIAFLQSLDVLCLPSMIRESKGLPVLEAWASGVPAVLPDHGAFSEMVADTGGGLLYDPQRPEALAEALGRMLRDEAFAAECGRRARLAVHEHYTSQRESREMLALYHRVCSERTSVKL